MKALKVKGYIVQLEKGKLSDMTGIFIKVFLAEKKIHQFFLYFPDRLPGEAMSDIDYFIDKFTEREASDWIENINNL